MYDIAYYSHYCRVLNDLETCIKQSDEPEFIKAHASAMRIVELIERTLFGKAEL
jgi:hypothetical protein